MATPPTNHSVAVSDSVSQAQGKPSVFAMDGAREIVARTAGAAHIEQQVRALEDAVATNPGLAFDLAKALIESVCKTIMRDRAQAVSDEDNLPRLFGTTLRQLRVLPDAHTADAETGRSIRKTVAALSAVVQGICELRNKQGFASHGKLAETQPLESVQAELVARAADAVVTFLYKAHTSYAIQSPTPKRVELVDNDDFNTFVDESHELVHIFDLQYRPSEVLYYVDYEAYVDKLALFGEDAAEDAVENGNAGEAVDAAGDTNVLNATGPVEPAVESPPEANQ